MLRWALGLVLLAGCAADVSSFEPPRVVIDYSDEWRHPLTLPSWSAGEMEAMSLLLWQHLEVLGYTNDAPDFILILAVAETEWPSDADGLSSQGSRQMWIREWPWRSGHPYIVCHEWAHLLGVSDHPDDVFDHTDPSSAISRCMGDAYSYGLGADIRRAVEAGIITRGEEP